MPKNIVLARTFEIITWPVILSALVFTIRLHAKLEGTFYNLLLVVSTICFIASLAILAKRLYPSNEQMNVNRLRIALEKVSQKSFWVNRFGGLLDQLLSLGVVLIYVIAFYQTLFMLPWPPLVEFAILMLLPLTLSIWIYYRVDYQTQQRVITCRRLVIYIIFALFVVYDQYNDFVDVVYQSSSQESEFIHFVPTSWMVLFFTFERLINSVMDDRAQWKKDSG